MARASLARQQVSDVGLVPAYSPASPDGHAVENSGGKLVLHVRNSGAADVIVTIRSGYTVGGLKLQDRVITVAAGASVFIGPLDASVYNQPNTTQVWIDYSSVDGVDVAALLIPA